MWRCWMASDAPPTERAVFSNSTCCCADNAVECFDASGTQQWSQNLDTSPQALLANSKDLLLFSGNTVQKLEAPAE